MEHPFSGILQELSAISLRGERANIIPYTEMFGHPSQGTNAHSKLNQDEAYVQTLSLSSAPAAMLTTPCLSRLRLLY